MSGGSYDYFYARCPESLARYANDLEDMAKKCDDPGDHYKDVDRDALREVGVHLRAISCRMKAMERLLTRWEDVTRAMEWWQSGDTGPDDVVETFGKLPRP